MSKKTVKIVILIVVVVLSTIFLCGRIAEETEKNHQEYLQCLDSNAKRVCDNIYYR